MEDVRIGTWIRVARQRLGLRQSDLAALAGVSEETVSRFERGHAGGMTLQTCRAIAAGVRIELFVVPRSARLGDLERQVDERHAALVEAVVGRVGAAGWEVATEYSFNYFGDRGSVDVLAWQPSKRALLIVEVKSELRDLQETLRALDIKWRVVPGRFQAEKGWRPESVGVVLVLPDISTSRDFVGRFRGIFDAALPARTVDVRRWIGEPVGGVRGIWFLRVSREALLTQRFRRQQRVRVPRNAVAVRIEPEFERGIQPEERVAAAGRGWERGFGREGPDLADERV